MGVRTCLEGRLTGPAHPSSKTVEVAHPLGQSASPATGFLSWPTVPDADSFLWSRPQVQLEGCARAFGTTVAQAGTACLVCQYGSARGPRPGRNVGDPSPPTACRATSGFRRGIERAGSFQVSPSSASPCPTVPAMTRLQQWGLTFSFWRTINSSSSLWSLWGFPGQELIGK